MPSPGVFFRHSHAFQSILMTNGDSKNSKVFKKIKEFKKFKIAWSRNLNSICIPVSPRPDYPILQGRAWRSSASDAPLDVAMRVVYAGCDSGFSRRGHESFRARVTSVIYNPHGHVEEHLKLSYVKPSPGVLGNLDVETPGCRWN